MTQKEWLLNILGCYHSGTYSEAERIVDFMISNGVVVLPCKVGDTVYRIWTCGGKKAVASFTVIRIDIGLKDPVVYYRSKRNFEYKSNFGDFGKRIFTTKESAEAAISNDEEPQDLHACPVCGHTFPYDVQAGVITYWHDCNFCPNCGAKMDRDGDE